MAIIDRCVCRDQTFASLKKVADKIGARSLKSLQKSVLFGDNCELCHPYVSEMLRTGQVRFSQVLGSSAQQNRDINVDVEPEKEID